MIPIPLNQIGLRWRDHKSALWWLGFFYRCPIKAWLKLSHLPPPKILAITYLLYIHTLPYLILLSLLGRLIVFGLFDVQPNSKTPFHPNGVLFHTFWMLSGFTTGYVSGISNGAAWGAGLGLLARIFNGFGFGISKNKSLGITVAVATYTFVKISVGVILSLFGGIFGGMAVASGFFMVLSLALGVASGIGLSIGSRLFKFLINDQFQRKITGTTNNTFSLIGWSLAGSLGVGLASGKLTMCIFYAAMHIFCASRLYYYPIHFAYVLRRPFVYRYSYHPITWDDMCVVPFLGLHRILLLLAEKTTLGEKEIERLIADYPSQRYQALRAKTILIAHKSGQLANLSKLNEAVASLPEGERKYLAWNKQLRDHINKICNLQMRLDTISRPIYREPTAELLCKEIENFRHRIAGFSDPTLTAFHAAALEWLRIAEYQLITIRSITTKEPTCQIFRAGDPVDSDEEAFVSRISVISELEQQIMSSSGCPGLVLYGRRRMGKSTILRNLNRFLPNDVITTFVSMQNPQMFSSRKVFVRSLLSEIQKQLPYLSNTERLVVSLRNFFDALTVYNTRLESEGKRLLLAVDEYETIDVKIGERVLPRELLDTIRESIQTHRHITWIFAGSHEIYELSNAAWTSYLVSARTIEVPVFMLAETRLLLTEPLKYSSLWQGKEAERPCFMASFWGENGIERIHSEAGGWPHLVQLIAETIVDLINNEEASEVTPELMQRALDKSVVRGQNVLYELMRRESTLPGEWDYLTAFRKRETQAPPEDERIAASLRRRLLIAEHNDEWRLRVPLMARWLKLKGQ